ncbi:MAG: RNA polymerase sigma factor [Sphingobacterium sp.]|uniref:RNA polymerase sigma factor n=1 Tax=Sphingobacterium sp. JB170 TaxID=1434842 RepID=UPI00097ECBA7|nr:sigma-70 family RNA polymerase sigma factor [Sphingobacterium sp. JB170]SJN24757.1 sigma-70 region 2 domain protein [Sphingobacterium sp. JB170]
MSKDNNDIDSAIIQDIRNGNNTSIDHIYRLYYPPIEKMILNNQGSREEAQDIFQETVMVLYDKVTNTNFELSSKLQTFLYAISYRLWLKQLTRGTSKYKVERIDEQHEDALAADEAAEEHEAMEANFANMEVALDGLGEPCKTILYDFYISNKSMTDICEKFGYTNTDNAKTQKYKCLQRLKKIFFKK